MIKFFTNKASQNLVKQTPFILTIASSVVANKLFNTETGVQPACCSQENEKQPLQTVPSLPKQRF